jgi:hypothetical protein
MPQFITIHRAPGLSADMMAANTPAVLRAELAKFQQIYVNLAAGFIVSLVTADTREQAEEQMEILGFPVDEMHEVQFAQSRAEMEQLAAQLAGR